MRIKMNDGDLGLDLWTVQADRGKGKSQDCPETKDTRNGSSKLPRYPVKIQSAKNQFIS